YGCRVVFETDSRSAFNKFKEDPDAYDLLVTDQTMPGTTGVELAQLMMEIRPELPVILCTGYSDQIDEAGASSLGIRGFMTKPIKSHEFLELVRDLLPLAKK
ncbi:MAG: response regulator, partial [Gammaproteobacteria bacterium]|nr:response regulator [Gammaproteobacteria bacterium]